MVAIDKIPIHLLKEDPTTEEYKLGTVTISKGEYANSEKINQIVDFLNEMDSRLFKLENK